MYKVQECSGWFSQLWLFCCLPIAPQELFAGVLIANTPPHHGSSLGALVQALAAVLSPRQHCYQQLIRAPWSGRVRLKHQWNDFYISSLCCLVSCEFHGCNCQFLCWCPGLSNQPHEWSKSANRIGKHYRRTKKVKYQSEPLWAGLLFVSTQDWQQWRSH